ncbi:MAG TPA: bifunctional class I SAM-dependent methyltransferase/glycosyltransferase family 2 protein [Pyrinomonadaceae bacterium]|nr:bifunctional class I SAM-dependent methyltransferase/glycosyltransferase family 2 protein [Pyrinomonadaceae bacterium]
MGTTEVEAGSLAGASRAARPTEAPDVWADPSEARYRQERVAHWDEVARREGSRPWGKAYHRRLAELYRFLVPKGARVLEVGCAQGDLLAALEPSEGVGVDFSGEMLESARRKHPHLRFLQADAHELDLEEKFDVIVLSDLVNDLWDVQRVLLRLRKLSTARTRVVFNFYSHLWGAPLRGAERLGLKRPNLRQNWLTVEDLSGLLALADFEVIRHREEILLPLPLPPVSTLANRYLVKLWPFNLLALTHFVVARPVEPAPTERRPVVSVVVAARNEEGNVPAIFARVPELGAGTELVFVEGGSSDDTYGAVERAIKEHPERRCKLLRQTGKGKGDAVRLGFREAEGDVLMILDADLTVPPEDLPRFLDALASGKADFVNGSRLVYPMEAEAMRFANLVGNKFFSLAFSWLLGQPIKDTLCGTKVLWKSDYERLAAGRSYFGEFDPFGDFDLLFGAAKLNLKILDLPVRYRDRTYGTTNIQRWRHGLVLLRMVAFAARRIKFI